MSASFQFRSYPRVLLEQGAHSLVKGFFASALGQAIAGRPPVYTPMFAGAKRAEGRDSLLTLCQVLLQFCLVFVFPSRQKLEAFIVSKYYSSSSNFKAETKIMHITKIEII